MKKFLLSLAVLAVNVMSLSAQDELTVADGTNTNVYLPIYGSYCDTEGTIGQMIYPKADLADMAGKDISKVSFYTAALPEKVNGCVLQISLKEVEEETFEYPEGTYSYVPFTDLTACGTTTLVTGETGYSFEFDTPFHYSGDNNLVVEVKVITVSNWASFSAYGVSQATGHVTGLAVYGSQKSGQAFLPKATFEYSGEPVDYEVKVTPASLDFGRVFINEDSTINVTVLNRGIMPVTPSINALEAPFSTTWTPTELATGQSTVIPVKYAPSAEGSHTGTLIVNCGEAGTFNVTLKGASIEKGSEMTVCDATNTNSYIPVYGSYIDTEDTQSQFIYPASKLSEINGRAITSVTFYPQNKISFSGCKIQLSVKVVDYNEFEYETSTSAPNNPVTEMTVVGTVVPGANDTELKFVFDEPFEYNGGNLAFETYVLETGTYSSCSFLGETQTTVSAFCSYKSWSGSVNYTYQNFLPKMYVTTVAGGEEPVEEGKTISYTAEQENGTVAVTLEDGTTVESQVTKVKEGEKFTVTVTPAEGYEVENIEVKAGENELNPINDEGKAETAVAYTYEMPAEDVAITVTFKEKEQPTAIDNLNLSNVKSVRYYNVAGVESATPFKGINIVVMEMTDGSKKTVKAVK